ncbi:MAG: hypothetical protein PHS95_02400 [Candidatus Pacebacteria bacterium]|nr:hypothetical protein [Candidatus Paceibacterota bacterium]
MNSNQLPVLKWEISPSYFKRKNLFNFLGAWLFCIVVLSLMAYSDSGNPGTLRGMMVLGAVVSTTALIAIFINALVPYTGYSYQIYSDKIIITEGTITNIYLWSEINYFAKEPAGIGFGSSFSFLVWSLLKTYNFIISLKKEDREIMVLTQNGGGSKLVEKTMSQYIEERERVL